jgi:hypothetical protein
MKTLAVWLEQVLKYLEGEELHVSHYGLGLKGVRALCQALLVSCPCLHSQSVSQSVSQPVSQPASQPASQPVSQLVSQPVSQSAQPSAGTSQTTTTQPPCADTLHTCITHAVARHGWQMYMLVVYGVHALLYKRPAVDIISACRSATWLPP